MLPVTALHNPTNEFPKVRQAVAMLIWFGILVRQIVARKNIFHALGRDLRGICLE